MSCSFRWTILSNCVINQSLLTLILDHVEVLLWNASYFMVFLRWLACSNPAWMFLSAIFTTESLTILASFRLHSHVTSMITGLLIVIWVRNANLSPSICTTLLIVDKLLILIKQSLFQLIIGLWVLCVLLLLLCTTLAIALDARLQIGVLDRVLAWGNKLIVVISSYLCTMLSLMSDKLIMHWEAIEGLIVRCFCHGLQVRRHLLAMEVNRAWRRLLNFVRLVNLVVHWHIVILVLSTRSFCILLALQLLLDSTGQWPHVLLWLWWWLIDFLVFNVAVHVHHMLVAHAIIDFLALARILIAGKRLLRGMEFA